MTIETILVLNAGSSSIKFQLFQGDESVLSGQIDGLGASAWVKGKTAEGKVLMDRALSEEEAKNHNTALQVILALLKEFDANLEVDAIGHRVVHGSAKYSAPVLVTDEVGKEMETFSNLAPLHNPHNLAGIDGAKAAFPGKPNVACFDTAFHRTQEFKNEAYAIPLKYYEEGIRRYGMHGQSFHYISEELHNVAPEVANGKIVVAHLGNGASMCAIENGKCVTTTMGFTPLDGLAMGTRSGLIDPGVIFYLVEQKGMTVQEVAHMLNKESGMKGLSGISQDMRDLEQSDSPDAQRALEYYDNRVKRELGALVAVMGGLDAIVFTGGIGENSSKTRSGVCKGLEFLGVELDEEANKARAKEAITISKPGSRVKVMAIPTNEEAMIARQTRDICEAL
ncbi:MULTISPECIES: acetate/propionate family kinase [Pseudovibrio]|uniref:acetate/propionate family kinase n=1 Tax=Stappiaceae TaxID=2821832 RepID=UPI0023664CBD|nr:MULTISPECIES: acetate kinase [Pseudovibrio]MDD7910103.1 acetate kinase [Pseudovibrio exalbescens]MDX5592386.1 acetate kinase [Pseudovibrio sp. SPO723]